MNELYKKQVALLIRIMPSVYKITDFAVHGGMAINLFHKNMPRYSVDIDLYPNTGTGGEFESYQYAFS